jgi:small subunit ribosomal protein S6
MKEAVAKYTGLITDNGGKIVCQEDWGLKKLAYPIQKKTTGFYTLIEFQAEPEFIARFETQFKRDERILRFQTVLMDKHAIAYAERRRAKRNGEAPAAEAPAEAPANE